MNRPTTLRRALLAPPPLRSSIFLPRRFQTALYSTPSISSSSFWLSLIPKPLRASSPSAAIRSNLRSKEWNPATFFIIVFLFIGSMSIQMIAMRNEFETFTRRADARIGLLREIIGRVKGGEVVDVEGLLGTGDRKREEEWKEVLKEIEEEDAVWKEKETRKRNSKKEEPIRPTSSQEAKAEERPAPVKSKAPAGFY